MAIFKAAVGSSGQALKERFFSRQEKRMGMQSLHRMTLLLAVQPKPIFAADAERS